MQIGFYVLLLQVIQTPSWFTEVWVSGTRPVQQTLISRVSNDFLMQTHGAKPTWLGVEQRLAMT